MNEINKLMDEIREIQHRFDALERPNPVDEIISKIADVLMDTICPTEDGCPAKEQGGTCYKHWVDYLQRVVAK